MSNIFQHSFAALQSHLIEFTERLHAAEVEKRNLRHNEAALKSKLDQLNAYRGWLQLFYNFSPYFMWDGRRWMWCMLECRSVGGRQRIDAGPSIAGRSNRTQCRRFHVSSLLCWPGLKSWTWTRHSLHASA